LKREIELETEVARIVGIMTATMDKLVALLKRQATYRLVIGAFILLPLAYFGPRYIGVIPGLLGMMVCLILMGRAVAANMDKRKIDTERPWWTKL
jgi:hypothetical protein